MKAAAMFNRRILRWLVLGALLLSVSTAFAQSGGPYDLTWNTIDGGGGASAGGSYTLTGTLGQADAGTLSGGSYTLEGGFWSALAGSSLFLPVTRR